MTWYDWQAPYAEFGCDVVKASGLTFFKARRITKFHEL